MTKKKSKKKDDRIEVEYFEEIEYTCSKTGEKKIKQVKVTRYKAVGERPVGNKGLPELEEDLSFDNSNDIDQDEE